MDTVQDVGVQHQGFDKSHALQVTGDPVYNSLGTAIEVRKGIRWHVRAFDRKSREFRDFVLTRMSKPAVPETSEFRLKRGRKKKFSETASSS